MAKLDELKNAPQAPRQLRHTDSGVSNSGGSHISVGPPRLGPAPPSGHASLNGVPHPTATAGQPWAHGSRGPSEGHGSRGPSEGQSAQLGEIVGGRGAG
jgi:hypothetical protein